MQMPKSSLQFRRLLKSELFQIKISSLPIAREIFLRAVLGEFSSLYDDVSYFPAFEMVSCLGEIAYFPRDPRDVRLAEVDMITQTFVNAHFSASKD